MITRPLLRPSNNARGPRTPTSPSVGETRQLSLDRDPQDVCGRSCSGVNSMQETLLPDPNPRNEPLPALCAAGRLCCCCLAAALHAP